MKNSEKSEKIIMIIIIMDLKERCNMKVRVMLIVVGCVRNGDQRVGKEIRKLAIRGRIEAIQTTALLRLI